MIRYAVRRLLELIPTTIGILLLTFVLFNVVGGSSAQVVLGKNATKASIEAFNKRYGYDKPLILNTRPGESAFDSQFFNFVKNVARGEFGMSTEHREPVIDVLKRGVLPSLSLTVPMLICGTLVGLALALGCAALRGSAFDKSVLVMSTVLMSVNYVVWVLAGQFFLAYKWRIFPIWGYESAFYIVLPAMIGVLSSLGVDIRFFRTAVLDEIYKPRAREGTFPHDDPREARAAQFAHPDHHFRVAVNPVPLHGIAPPRDVLRNPRAWKRVPQRNQLRRPCGRARRGAARRAPLPGRQPCHRPRLRGAGPESEARLV